MIHLDLTNNPQPSILTGAPLTEAGDFFNLVRRLTLVDQSGRPYGYTADDFVLSREEVVKLRNLLNTLLDSTRDAFIEAERGDQSEGEQEGPATSQLGDDLVNRLLKLTEANQ